MKRKKIVLAYSGGLDTSIILKWLQEKYNAEVIAYTANIGQKINKKKIINNAKKLGVKKIIIENDELELSYRKSNILDNDIVVSAAFNVEFGDKKEIEEELKIIKNNRESSQPIKTKTSGSSFKNPTGSYAAELIDLAGCKGLKIGDAVVSSKHANFLINTDNATAGQIEDLGKLIIEKVYNKFQIILDWEIKIVGDAH